MTSNQELDSLKAVSAMLLADKIKPLKEDYELDLSAYKFYSAFDPIMEAYKDPHVSWETLKPIVNAFDYSLSGYIASCAKSKDDFEDLLKLAWTYTIVSERPASGRSAMCGHVRGFRDFKIPDPSKTVNDVFAAIIKKKVAAKKELDEKKAVLDKWESHLRVLAC
jgi:hypothetical protein